MALKQIHRSWLNEKFSNKKSKTIRNYNNNSSSLKVAHDMMGSNLQVNYVYNLDESFRMDDWP